MTDIQPNLAGQLTALTEAMGGWQQEVLAALHSAQAASAEIDPAELAVLLDQLLAAADTRAALVAAVNQQPALAQQLARLISQQRQRSIIASLQATRRYLPDISAARGLTLADHYSIGQSDTLTPAGATTPTGAAVQWQLSELAGVTASAPQVADGQSLQLTFTGPGSLTLTAMAEGVAARPVSLSWTASAAVIARPTITSPAAGITNLALQPVITASAFSVTPTGYDTHQHSQCRVLNSSGRVVWDSGTLSARTQFAINQDLPDNSALDIQLRYKGTKLGWSDWSPSVRVTTRKAGGLGYIYPDGGIGGPVVNGYRLIVAPGSKRGTEIRHGLRGTETSLQNIGINQGPDPQSGYDNTNTLINGYSDVNDNWGSIGPSAAQFCRRLGPEWYLPNKDELAAIVAMAEEIDAADNSEGLRFTDLNYAYIWSSTERSPERSWAVRANGDHIHPSYRQGDFSVVPIRREPV